MSDILDDRDGPVRDTFVKFPEKKRIAVVTAGHLSTCPRMLKAADALAEEGHHVHVVSTRATDWATAADEALRQRRRERWQWSVVDYSRRGAPWTYYSSGVRQQISRRVTRYGSRRSFALAARALARVHSELIRAAQSTDADFFYGGTVGGIGATFEAARRCGRDYALDLEDFYSGDHPGDPNLVGSIERVETEVLGGARFLTAASVGIADAYRSSYGVEPVTIHNTFPLPAAAPETPPSSDTLKLYWFSQTIGRGRGLEDAVEGVRRAGIPAELHLRGNPDPGYVTRLESFVSENVPQLRLVIHRPIPPDEMVTRLAGYDVGLAIEQRTSVNREICLTNKALTYMLGGLALAMTETEGQRPLIEELGDKAITYAPGDVDTLAAGLKRLATDKAFRERCRRASWEAAKRRWHWEHADERGRLVQLFASIE